MIKFKTWYGLNPAVLRHSVNVRRRSFYVRDRRTRQLRIMTSAEWRDAMTSNPRPSAKRNR